MSNLYSLILTNAHIYFIGFIQPDVLFNHFQRGDLDDFIARMSIVTPRPVFFSYKDFTKPTDSITVEEILRQVRTNHLSPNLEYRFMPEALEIFRAYFDELVADVNRTDVFDETEQRSVLNKMLVSPRVIAYSWCDQYFMVWSFSVFPGACLQWDNFCPSLVCVISPKLVSLLNTNKDTLKEINFLADMAYLKLAEIYLFFVKLADIKSVMKRQTFPQVAKLKYH